MDASYSRILHAGCQDAALSSACNFPRSKWLCSSIKRIRWSFTQLSAREDDCLEDIGDKSNVKDLQIHPGMALGTFFNILMNCTEVQN